MTGTTGNEDLGESVHAAAGGTLWQWLGTGSGTFGQGTQIGSGWTNFELAAY